MRAQHNGMALNTACVPGGGKIAISGERITPAGETGGADIDGGKDYTNTGTTKFTDKDVSAAAENRIRDADMAKEMMCFTKNIILQQTAAVMLAQANQEPQTVWELLQ